MIAGKEDGPPRKSVFNLPTLLLGYELRYGLCEGKLFYRNNYLVSYFWLSWASFAVQAFSLVVASGAALQHSSRDSHCGVFLCCRAWALEHAGLLELWHVGSMAGAPRLQGIGLVIVAQRLSCSATCGILLDQGLNPCLLHSQEGSLPPSHPGSPKENFSHKLAVRVSCVSDIPRSARKGETEEIFHRAVFHEINYLGGICRRLHRLWGQRRKQWCLWGLSGCELSISWPI